MGWDRGAIAKLDARLPIRIPRAALVLLHHKFLRRVFFATGAEQHGHRDKVPTIATIRCQRMVATEFGM